MLTLISDRAKLAECRGAAELVSRCSKVRSDNAILTGILMHTRRLTALILGLWLGASLLMDWISYEGTTTIPAAFEAVRQREPILVRTIGDGPIQQLLRFQTAELNRNYTYFWGFAQIAIGVVVLVVALFATNGNKPALILSAAMVVIVLGMQFAVMPVMLENDRILDFATSDMARERAAYAGTRNTYIGMEILKLLTGFGLAGVLLYREREGSGSSRRRRRRSENVDIIDYADNSRVNR
jgi:hypothetical protein